MSALDVIDAVVARLDALALTAFGPDDPVVPQELEALAGLLREAATEVAAGAVRAPDDSWDLTAAAADPDLRPSVRFVANRNVPHAAVRVFVGAEHRTHALVGTLRCRATDLAALRGIPAGTTLTAWERT